jgi:hypothetical protein
MANEFATIAIGGTLRVSLIAQIGENRSLQAFRENIKSPTDAASSQCNDRLEKGVPARPRRACFISSQLLPGGDLSRFFDEVENFFAGHDAPKCLGYLILYGRLLMSNRMILAAKNFLSTPGISITKKHHAQKKSRHRCPPPLDT